MALAQAFRTGSSAFFFFYFGSLPWANLSVLYKEPVFRSAQHYICFQFYHNIYNDGE